MKNRMNKFFGLLFTGCLVISSVNAAPVKVVEKAPEKRSVFSRFFGRKNTQAKKNIMDRRMSSKRSVVSKKTLSEKRRVVSTRGASPRKATVRGDKCSNGRRGKYSAADAHNGK